MKRECTEIEKNIICRSQSDILMSVNNNAKKGENIKIPNDQLYINGGTVIECIWDTKEQELLLIFAEDDFVDYEGNVCCFYYTLSQFIDLKFGDRILLVHCTNGTYFPMGLNESTKMFIPQCAPEYFEKTNWKEVTRLPHPMALQLENESVAMSREDKEYVREQFEYLKKLRAREKFAAFLIGLATFIIFFVTLAVMVADEVIVETIPLLIGLVLVPMLSIVAIIVFVILLKRARTKPIDNLNYKKMVIFQSIGESEDYISSVESLYVYEKINDRIQVAIYPIGFNNFNLKDVNYGQILYKCSHSARNYTEGLYYFY